MSLVMTSGNFIIIGYNYLMIIIFCSMLLLIDIDYINHQCLLPSSAMALDIDMMIVPPSPLSIISDSTSPLVKLTITGAVSAAEVANASRDTINRSQQLGEKNLDVLSRDRLYILETNNNDRLSSSSSSQQTIARLQRTSHPLSKFSREFSNDANEDDNSEAKSFIDSSSSSTSSSSSGDSDTVANVEHPKVEQDANSDALHSNINGFFQPKVVNNNHQQFISGDHPHSSIQRVQQQQQQSAANHINAQNTSSILRLNNEMKKQQQQLATEDKSQHLTGLTDETSPDNLMVETAEKLISQLTHLAPTATTTNLASSSSLSNIDTGSIDGFDLEIEAHTTATKQQPVENNKPTDTSQHFNSDDVDLDSAKTPGILKLLPGKGDQYLIASSVTSHFPSLSSTKTSNNTSTSTANQQSSNDTNVYLVRLDKQQPLSNSSTTSYYPRHYSQNSGKYGSPINTNSIYNSHSLNYMHNNNQITGNNNNNKPASQSSLNSLNEISKQQPGQGQSSHSSNNDLSSQSQLNGGQSTLSGQHTGGSLTSMNSGSNDNNNNGNSKYQQLISGGPSVQSGNNNNGNNNANNNSQQQQQQQSSSSSYINFMNNTNYSCGRQQVTRESKIVGGNNTYEGEFPWAVSIQRHGNHHCGGVIVGRKWILTAAHCVRSQLVNNLIVRVGGHNLLKSNSLYNHLVRDYPVDQIIIHEDFSRYDHMTMSQTKSSANTNNADIALLRLKQDITWNDHAWPVCFPSKESGNFAGHDAVVIGWGKLSEKSEDFSNDLQKVRLTIIDNKVCQNWFRQAGRDMPIDDRIICAGFRNGGKDACHGDSGGPLLSRINGHYVVVGVVSTGIGCARPLLPGLYSRVSSYVSWIERYVVS